MALHDGDNKKGNYLPIIIHNSIHTTPSVMQRKNVTYNHNGVEIFDWCFKKCIQMRPSCTALWR